MGAPRPGDTAGAFCWGSGHGIRRGGYVREGLLASRPTFPTVHVSNARQGFFERADFDRLCAELPEYLRAAATFAYLTGWRTRSEVLPLRWANVDFVNGVVRLDVRTTKNDAGRIFPFAVLPELGDLLRRQRLAADAHELLTGQPCLFVFGGSRGGFYTTSGARRFGISPARASRSTWR
jgi:integrase